MEKSWMARATVRGGRAAIPLPFDPDTEWGAKQRQDACGTVAGRTVRGKLEREAEGWVFPLGPAWWRDAGLDPATAPELPATLRPEGPLLEELAPDLRAAMDASPEAVAMFYSIAPHYRKNVVRWIETARRPETRAARIVDGVAAWAAGRREP